MSETAKKFFDAHPWADMDLANELSESLDGKVPYCDTCNDWHPSNEKHSIMETAR